MNNERPSLKVLKQLAALVERHKLDSIELPGVKITKTRHLFSQAELKAANGNTRPPAGGLPESLDEMEAEIARSLGVGGGA